MEDETQRAPLPSGKRESGDDHAGCLRSLRASAKSRR